MCFDFEAYNLGFMESDNVYDFFNEKQEKMIKLLLPEIKKKNEEYRLIAQKFLQKDSKIFWLDLEKTTSFGDYPTAGKVVGIVHRINKEPRATIGLAESFLTYRIDGLEFSVKEAIAILRKKIPHGRIWGGGHDYAGTIKFIPAVKEEVRSEIRKYINS